MKKNVMLSLILIIFISCKERQLKSDLKIIKNYKVSNISDTISVFSCNNFDKEKKYGELKVLGNHPLRIKCMYQGSYGGETINLEINDQLKIIKADYCYDSYDIEGKAKEVYSINNVKLVINKIPTENNLNGLEGKLLLIGNVKIISDSFYEFSKIENFKYVGYFICK